MAQTEQVELTWHGRAACQGLDATIFFPATDEEADLAKSICGVCPVQSECLEHALSVREKEGVWGGCTETERRRIVRQRRRAAAKARALQAASA